MIHRFASYGGCVLLAGLAASADSFAQTQVDESEIERARADFVSAMVSEHAFDRSELEAALATAEIQRSILDAISRPVERVVPWHEYRQIFVTPDRIREGVEFWEQHSESVELAAARFGVEPEMLVAIIGIESRFGERMGSYRVLDALATLAFAYPPRARFFRSELESFFLLSMEEGVELLQVRGSYAGAMGAGQFIPSSFRAYAVDADNDGQRDLWENWDDILASVANYFSEHGWRSGEIVAEPASRTASFNGSEPSNGLDLTETVGSLRSAGYEFDAELPVATPAAVYALESDDTEFEYWIGYHNFHVITRYNRSFKYAMAAHQLSQAIRERYASELSAAR